MVVALISHAVHLYTTDLRIFFGSVCPRRRPENRQKINTKATNSKIQQAIMAPCNVHAHLRRSSFCLPLELLSLADYNSEMRSVVYHRVVV